jgi:hypothetical protein
VSPWVRVAQTVFTLFHLVLKAVILQ